MSSEISPVIEAHLGTVEEQLDNARNICRSSAYPGVTQAALARAMDADEAQVSRWLNGRAGISLESRIAMNDALHRLLYHKEDE